MMQNKFFEIFNIEPEFGPSFDNGIICTCDITAKPPKITPEIILNLEDIALNCDYLLTKRPSDEALEDDLYLWSDTTNMQNLQSTAHKNRKDAILYLLTTISEWHDIKEDVRELFNAK